MVRAYKELPVDYKICSSFEVYYAVFEKIQKTALQKSAKNRTLKEVSPPLLRPPQKAIPREQVITALLQSGGAVWGDRLCPLHESICDFSRT
jgi:hypothetical protein